MRRYRRRRFSTRGRRRFRSRRSVYRRRGLRRRRPPVVRMSYRQRALRRPEFKKLKGEDPAVDIRIRELDAGSNVWHLSQMAHSYMSAGMIFGVDQGTSAGTRIGAKINVSRIIVKLDFNIVPSPAWAGDTAAMVGQFFEIHAFLLLNTRWGTPLVPTSSADGVISDPSLTDLSVYNLLDESKDFVPGASTTAATGTVHPIMYGIGSSSHMGSTTKVLAAKKIILRFDPTSTRRRVTLKTRRPFCQYYTSGTDEGDITHNRVQVVLYNRGTVRYLPDPEVVTYAPSLFAKWHVTATRYMSFTDA